MLYTMEDLVSKFKNAANAGDREAATSFKGAIIDEQKRVASYTNDDGGFRFDRLKENRQYNQDLKDAYKDKKGREFKGNIEDLQEDNFEYWNSTMLNELSLLHTGAEIKGMNDEQRARQSRLFETYDNTNMTGEGSRDTFEQAKDAGALLWAPSTYLGGGFIKAGLNTAGKAGLRKMLSGVAARSAVVGGGISGASDAGMQGIEMRMDDDKEFDTTRAAMATGMGAALGGAAPAIGKAVGKGIGKTLEGVSGVGRMITDGPSAIRRGSENTLKSFINNNLGGSKAAADDVVDSTMARIGTGDKSGAAVSFTDSAEKAIATGRDAYNNKYVELGEVDVSKEQVSKLINDLHSKEGMNTIGNLSSIREAMEGGVLTPTEALRKTRSTIGSEANRASNQLGSNTGSDQVLRDFHLKSRVLFNQAAAKSGKGVKAKQLDDAYSGFVKAQQNTYVKGALKGQAEAASKLGQVVNSGEPLRITNFLKENEILAKTSGDVNYMNGVKSALRETLAESLFTGNKGTKLRSMLSSKNGVEALTKVFEGKVTSGKWLEYKKVIEGAQGKGGVSPFLLTAIGSGLGFAGGGPVGAAIGVGAANSLAMLAQSKSFANIARWAAVKTEKGKHNTSKLITKVLKDSEDAKTIKEVIDFALGAGVVGTTYKSGEEEIKEGADKATQAVVSGLQELYSDLGHYFK